MAESVASRNERLSDYIADVTAVSIHSADPGTTGASELAGGTPTYARIAPAFAVPVSGASDLTADLAFNAPAGAYCAFYGLWKGATFFYGGPLDQVESFGNQGVLLLRSIPLSA